MSALTTRFLVASVGVVLAALTGCGDNSQQAATTTTTTAASDTDIAPSAPPDPRTLERAGAAALAKVPDSTLISIKFNSRDEGVWDVEVVTPDGTEQRMEVGDDGVTVLVGPTPKNDSDADKAEHRNLVQAARLDYRAAVDKVLAAVPNGSITELDLDDKNGTTVWEADVWDINLVEHEVAINAGSGELVSNKQG